MLLDCFLVRDDSEKYTRVYDQPKIVPALISALVSVPPALRSAVRAQHTTREKVSNLAPQKSINRKNRRQLVSISRRKKTDGQTHLYM
jgi:hypothetical protein